uniref:Uncharacterized protein n=1 Tax=viral metagenome TaxID=1070528 RepID=A0A6H1ZWD6_9ZZZZ
MRGECEPITHIIDQAEFTKIRQVRDGLLYKIRDKKITMADFDRECAYWALAYLNEYKFTPYPTKPTQIVEYQNRKRYDVKFRVEDKFWQQDEIKPYMASFKIARGRNISNGSWLEFMKNSIPAEDTPNQEKIQELLLEYRQ